MLRHVLFQVSACYTQQLTVGSATEMLMGDTPAELQLKVETRVKELVRAGLTPRLLPSLMKHRVRKLLILNFFRK